MSYLKYKIFLIIMIMACIICFQWKLRWLHSKENEQKVIVHELDAINGHDNIIHIHDRTYLHDVSDYFFFEKYCFVRTMKFSHEPNGKLISCHFFFVKKIDRTRLKILMDKFINQFYPPPYLPVPFVYFEIYNSDGDSVLFRANDDFNIYTPILKDLEELISHKEEIHFIPSFFYQKKMQRLLEYIQDVPQENYSEC